MNLMALNQDGVNYVLCPKQGNKIEDAVLHTQVMYFRIFCPKTGSGFQTLKGSPIPKYWSSIPPGPKSSRL